MSNISDKKIANLINHLQLLKNIVDIVVMELEQVFEEMSQPTSDNICRHPDLEETTTMGDTQRSYLCKACLQTIVKS